MLYRKNITINKLLNVNFVLTRNNTMKNQLAKIIHEIILQNPTYKIIHLINFLQDFDTYKNNSKILYNVCIKKKYTYHISNLFCYR